jgi:hypothetical protein
VLHWGSYSSGRAKEPRISLALEFGPEGEIDPRGPLPDFSQRLKFIGRAIERYLEAFEPGRFREEWLRVAETLRGPVPS